MAASAPVGRPKIEGLVSLNLRILQEQLDALDALVDQLRAERRDPALNRTDLIREAIADYLAARASKSKRSR
jgi:hypothetical protein